MSQPQKDLYENNQQVRTISKDGEVWFLAHDVCKILGLTAFNAIRWLEDSEKSKIERHLLAKGARGGSAMWIISRTGLISLTDKSKSPLKNHFKRWCYYEAFPSMASQRIEKEETMTNQLGNLQRNSDQMNKICVSF
ncbi:MAG: Bro-N domain-containing protein [Proteobacteria bacterium]|nr:Bro-N domain-containing protein [Desulfobacula sp.]MBU3951008.1 Bro-N domain-containing protein [Pseudomonadota bacterium]MBU4131576.1 Bro-N domain-containing protein [Pseudomonadota bacterium]